MNTAEYITTLISRGLLELAGIGAVWSLFYSRRILLAASPKTDAPAQPKRDTKAKPGAEKPPTPALVPGIEDAA